MLQLIKKKKPKEKVEIIPSEVIEKIHVMPGRFYIEKKQKSSQIFIWTAVILALAGIGIAVFILINNYLKPETITPQATLPTNESVEPAVTPPTEPTLNTNLNINVTPPEPEPEPAAGTEPGQDEPVQPTGTEDEDNDGLTLTEEQLYISNASNPDTDSDGYPDGAEVSNGYSPRDAGVTLLGDGLTKLYENSTQNYSLEKPFDWLVKSLDDQNTEVLIDSRVGEFIKIFVKQNSTPLTLTNWISENDLLQDINQLIPVTINNLSGFRTANGLKYYLASSDSSFIYILSYEAAGLAKVSFKTTFEMMAKSFKLGD